MARPVLIVVPTFLRQPRDLEATLKALETLRETEPDEPIMVVDDGSPVSELVDEIDAARSRLQFELKRCTINQGFATAVNHGLRVALHNHWDVCLANADLEMIDAGWLTPMRLQLRSDRAGLAEVVGALLLYPNGLIQHGGIYFSLLHRCFEHVHKYAPQDLPEAQTAKVLPVTGALQFIRLETMRTVGLYDEGFRLGWEDVDYCLRVFLAGGECVYQPATRAYHHESLFRGTPDERIAEWQRLSWIRLMEKIKGVDLLRWVPSMT